MPIMMRPLWSREPCSCCGVEGLASRGDPVPADKPYVCEGCEMYQSGYDDGLEAAAVKAQTLRDMLDELFPEPETD